MDKSYKKPLLLITFGVILFAAFNNLNYVANFLKSCIGLLAPILSGLLLAFVLSVPVRGLAKRLRRKLTKATDRQIDMISLLLTLICVIAIIALLCVIAIPQLTASVKSIAALVQEKWPDWVGLLQRYGIDTEKLSAHFAALDWKSIFLIFFLFSALSDSGNYMELLCKEKSSNECREVTEKYRTGRSAYLWLGQLFMRLFAGLL